MIMIWTILGISVAVLSVFCITVAEMLVGKPIFEQNRLYLAGALAAAGVVAWFLGRAMQARRERSALTSDEEGGQRVFLLVDGRYWGPMLLALGLITLFIRPLKQIKEAAPPILAGKPAAKQVAEAPAPKPQPVSPAVFPKMKMQGVIMRSDQTVAIINGHSYAAGDRVGDVLVKTIDRSSVILELQGELKVLTLN